MRLASTDQSRRFPAENGPCSLYDALGRNFDQQILEESKLSRYTTIRTLPPILHVLIQRTQSNGSKNGNPVIIPETLVCGSIHGYGP